jgi:hypothetical protein
MFRSTGILPVHYKARARRPCYRMKTHLISFSLALAFTLICLAVCGASLGFFFAGFFFLICLLPPLVLTQCSTSTRLFTTGCVIDGIGIVWLFTTFRAEITFIQWLKCYLVLIGFAALLAGVAIALLRLHIAPLAACSITVVLALLWLSSPVWLASNLSDAGVARLVSIHPLFAINGVLSNLGTWSHFPIAYRELTTLGQDISYSLPTNIWPSALAHLIAGLVLWWAGSSKPSATAGRSAREEPSEDARSSAADQS